jgi:hypothetical protein
MADESCVAQVNLDDMGQKAVCSVILDNGTRLHVGDVWKKKLDDMAGYDVAGDAFPPAAILAPWLPRLEVVACVVYALLEGQQGIPLALYAVLTDGMGRMELTCIGDEEEPALV